MCKKVLKRKSISKNNKKKKVNSKEIIKKRKWIIKSYNKNRHWKSAILHQVKSLSYELKRLCIFIRGKKFQLPQNFPQAVCILGCTGKLFYIFLLQKLKLFWQICFVGSNKRIFFMCCVASLMEISRFLINCWSEFGNSKITRRLILGSFISFLFKF